MNTLTDFGGAPKLIKEPSSTQVPVSLKNEVVISV
jgi:hypothetical protein